MLEFISFYCSSRALFFQLVLPKDSPILGCSRTTSYALNAAKRDSFSRANAVKWDIGIERLVITCSDGCYIIQYCTAGYGLPTYRGFPT